MVTRETDERREASQAPARRGTLSAILELPILVLVAFGLALLLKTFLIQAFFIPSQSMLPTLEVGDRVLVNKLAYAFREPERGEVVVFREEGVPGLEDRSTAERVRDFLASGLGTPTDRDFIKRIIGLPGDTLELRDGTVFVNGQPLPEETIADGGYLLARDLSDFGPVDVPADQYFMLGDNRQNSADSRFSLGAIDREDLVGRAFVRIWPVSRVDTLPIADYGGAQAAQSGESWAFARPAIPAFATGG